MLDFLKIHPSLTKNGTFEIRPKFLIKKSSDLMIRGGDFYAIWVEERGLWSTDEFEAFKLIDAEIDRFVQENPQYSHNCSRMYLWDASTGMADQWRKYCQKQMPDNFHMLDEKLIFMNDPVDKKDYSSKRLSYPLEKGSCPSWDKLIGTLYSEEERRKIEWAIGSIITGDSKTLQKFMVFYGAAGTGKSTILNIVQKLFDGYFAVFDAKALGSASNSFALEAFASNPLVAIQHDGDLSHIEDNTRINSLVSHELMTVNEKFKSTYTNAFKAFLFMGTNKPVKITDAKSGLLRRLIDVSPSGEKVSQKDYKHLTKQVDFELGAIAWHCKEVYLEDPGRYDSYIPVSMMGASNDFYNFVYDSYYTFQKENGTTLKAAWELYKAYCDEAKVSYPYSQRIFKEELKNYFWDYSDRYNMEDGTRVRSYYYGFKTKIFDSAEEQNVPVVIVPEEKHSWLKFDEGISGAFDEMAENYPAQYTKDTGTPSNGWDFVTTILKDIDSSKLHYVKVPENHIIIDFDIPGDDGEKNFERNFEAASKWPPTYAELSKSGAGIHLHYIYTGDPQKLSRVYDDHIEIKVFNGKASLRRKLTKCNELPIATISSGLPLKGEKMVNFDAIKSEKGLRTLIKKNLNKEVHPGTKPSIDFIYKILDDAYNSGMAYDVTDMRGAILAFGANSTNQADYCIKLVNKMKFKSEDIPEPGEDLERPIAFYDIEVFPNLFLINWKAEGENAPVVRMINPKPIEVENLIERYRLIGFNCRRYDNHLIYALAYMGYSTEQLYNLSQKIISGSSNAMFSNAYNLSYTDVYDFASAGNKKSLKKLEIEMSNKANDPESKMDELTRSLCKKIKHHELGLPWDKPVDESLWIKVAEYCDDDVYATEAAFHYLNADWTARQILAELAGSTVNDTTNSLTTKIIFGNERKPQSQFNYRDLSKPVHNLDEETYNFLAEACPEMMSQTHGEEGSLLPYFPGYVYDHGKSTYRGENVGEGGFAQGVPGMYGNVALLDVISMHPHSTIAECLFGVRFTTAYRDIVEGRVSIKHEAWTIVNEMLEGKLTPFIQKVINGEMTSGDLANALKTAINSVYGLTAANFENPFRDPRNVDNIVAKRGALFMIDLKNEVLKRGFQVAHIKTDSIKIPDATPEIIEFVMNFGLKYGYTFEHEATYDRMTLVNDAVYIAKYKDKDECEKLYGYIPGDNKKKSGKWTATGTQFQIPYVFKKLFSKEDIKFEDMCETKSVTSALYLDMNESLPDVSEAEKTVENAVKKAKEFGIVIDISKPTGDGELDPLLEEIKKGHDYHFIGRVGQFCPIQPGCGGGLLVREMTDKNTGAVKYASATGSKGYRWLESDMVKSMGKENDIDRGYYDAMVTEAVNAIVAYGDYTWFVSDDPYVPPSFENGEYMLHPVYAEELPWG